MEIIEMIDFVLYKITKVWVTLENSLKEIFQKAL